MEKKALKSPYIKAKVKSTIFFSISIALLALALSILSFFSQRNVKVSEFNNQVITLDEVLSDGVLTVGYGAFPPYTMEDLVAQDTVVVGYSVDVLKEIRKLSNNAFDIEWVRFSWETIKADLSSKKIELIVDPVYQTIPRSLELGFSKPYAYFGIGAGIVKKDDFRFTSFNDLNRDDITISLAEGWTTSEYARENLDKPNFKPISVTGDAYNQLDEVLLGRVDVALNDVPTVAQYAEANSNKVKAIFLENPPSSVPGGFVTFQNSLELINFLNTSIDILIANNALRKIDEKWNTFHYIPRLSVIPASGLQD